MAGRAEAPSEYAILRGRRAGTLSCEESFEHLYGLYARDVLGWLRIQHREAEADDLAQDVWSTFYLRWRNWQFPPELDSPEAKPVLSFLYRTAVFVQRGWRRKMRPYEAVEEANVADEPSSPERLHQRIEFRRCLDLAAEICLPEELDVLTAKLSGLPGAEIAAALEITPAVVDHRYRNAVERLRRKLEVSRKGVRHA